MTSAQQVETDINLIGQKRPSSSSGQAGLLTYVVVTSGVCSYNARLSTIVRPLNI